MQTPLRAFFREQYSRPQQRRFSLDNTIYIRQGSFQDPKGFH